MSDSTSELHPDVAAVLQELDLHRTRFIALARSLSRDELIRPVPNSSWVARDFVAHLATIDVPVMRWFVSIRDGKGSAATGDGGGPFEVDHWNDARVAERRELPLEDVIHEMQENRSRMREVLATFTQEHLDGPLDFAGDSKRGPSRITLRQYLQGWCKHDVMHAVDMMRAIPEKVDDSLRGWFEDPVVDGYQRAMNRDT